MTYHRCIILYYVPMSMTIFAISVVKEGDSSELAQFCSLVPFRLSNFLSNTYFEEPNCVLGILMGVMAFSVHNYVPHKM